MTGNQALSATLWENSLAALLLAVELIGLLCYGFPWHIAFSTEVSGMVRSQN